MKLYVKKRKWDNNPLDFDSVDLDELYQDNMVNKFAVLDDSGDCNVYSRLKGKWVVVRNLQVDKEDVEDFINNVELEADETLKEYMESVHLKNIEQQLIKESLLKESTPEVGLFWIDMEAKEIFSVGVKVSDGESYGAGTPGHYTVHPSSHFQSWDKIYKNDNIKNKHYEDVPRGRVGLKRSPVVDKNVFMVYMCPDLNTEEFKNMVLDEFHLPLSKTIFDFSDEHYVINDEFLYEWNETNYEEVLKRAMAGDIMWYDLDLIMSVYAELRGDTDIDVKSEDFIEFLDANYKEIGNDVWIDLEEFEKLK